MLARRILANPLIREYVEIDAPLADGALDERTYERAFAIFPSVIGAQRLLPRVFDNIRDGHDTYGPREVIHLFEQALQVQRRRAASQVTELPGLQLLEIDSFESALRAVSEESLNAKLLGEYAWAAPHVEKLRNGRVRYTKEQLADVLAIDEVAAGQAGDQLVRIGLFRRTGGGIQPFEVAKVYQPCLGVGSYGK